jgi:hypothetical protein
VKLLSPLLSRVTLPLPSWLSRNVPLALAKTLSLSEVVLDCVLSQRVPGDGKPASRRAPAEERATEMSKNREPWRAAAFRRHRVIATGRVFLLDADYHPPIAAGASLSPPCCWPWSGRQRWQGQNGTQGMA